MTAKESFEKIYNEYHGAVETYFKKKVPPSDVDDLVQQTFMKMWICIADMRPIRSYKSILFVTAKNVLVDFYRKRSIFISYDELSEFFDIPSYDDIESHTEAKLILLSLSPDDKIIAAMKCEGYKSREIAKVVGISASAVRTRLQKIKAVLEK